jgi:hypothetical protein
MTADNPSKENQPGQEGSRTGGKSKRRSVRKRRDRKPGGQGSEPRAPSPAAESGAQDKSQQDRRDRRRRRRAKSKQRQQGETSTAPAFQDADLDLPPLKPVMVYTHVIRPAIRDSYEFRADHFSKATRRLEDFKIDLSPLFREEEESAKRADAALAGDLDGELARADEDWSDDAEWSDEEDWNEDEHAGDTDGDTDGGQ